MNEYLLGLLWKSTVILGAVWIIVAARPRASAASRHLIWMTGLFAVVLLPAVIAVAPQWSAPLPLAVQALATPAAGPAAPPLPWRQSLQWLWFTGVLIMLLRLLASHGQAWSMVRASTAIARRNGIDILESSQAVTPFVWGFLRPIVVMPAEAAEWPEAMRRAAVDHELAHISRLDCWWQLLANLACCAYWFQPLAWVAARRSTQEREQACDDAVLCAGAASSDYAAHLLSVARLSIPAPAAAAAMVRRSGLERRIRTILDSTVNHSPVNRREWMACAAAAIILLIPLAAVRAQDEIHKIENGVSAPKLLHKVEPKYDPDAKAAGVEGTTVLSVVITAQGEPRDITVKKSLHPGLDAQGKAAVEQWLFEPGKKDGKPVAVRATIEINFKLK